MAVKIDMDMPKSCYDCPIRILVQKYDEILDTSTCAFLEQDVGDFMTERHEDCPLKECK